jgi:hypothetical protein
MSSSGLSTLSLHTEGLWMGRFWLRFNTLLAMETSVQQFFHVSPDYCAPWSPFSCLASGASPCSRTRHWAATLSMKLPRATVAGMAWLNLDVAMEGLLVLPWPLATRAAQPGLAVGMLALESQRSAWRLCLRSSQHFPRSTHHPAPCAPSRPHAKCDQCDPLKQAPGKGATGNMTSLLEWTPPEGAGRGNCERLRPSPPLLPAKAQDIQRMTMTLVSRAGPRSLNDTFSPLHWWLLSPCSCWSALFQHSFAQLQFHSIPLRHNPVLLDVAFGDSDSTLLFPPATQGPLSGRISRTEAWGQSDCLWLLPCYSH